MAETKNVDYLIIGGGVAGTSAAEVIRKNDPKGSVSIVSDEPYRFYSRIMLSKPNFFLGKIPFENIWLKKESWYAENNIELLPGKTAAALDAKEQIIKLSDGTELKYKKLLLALGAHANLWRVKGAEKNGVCYLRSLDDAKKIMADVKTAKSAVLVGSAFTSFEMCDMLRMAGIEVTLVMLEPHFWHPLLDEPSGKMIEQALEKGGVKIIRKAEVGEVLGGSDVTGVVLKSGEEIPCQMVVAGIGTAVPKEWLGGSGLLVNRGILCNEYLETNLPCVWSAGDSAEFNDLVLGEQVLLGNWVNAQNHGRIAGNNMTAEKKAFRMVSFYTAQGFGITIAFAGDVRNLPERKVVMRGSQEAGAYGRIILNGKQIIGATLINRTPDLAVITRLIESRADVSEKLKELADSGFDIKSLLTPAAPAKTPAKAVPDKKIRVGWFSFSCCEDNTVVMTEVMNDHWQEWKDLFDFRHARVLKSKNVLDEMDIAFIEGAAASEEQAEKMKAIRSLSKIVVAVGACAVQGIPAGQRNNFTPEQQAQIDFLLARFKAAKKVQKVSDVIKVDASIPGCPMDPNTFLKTVNELVAGLKQTK